MQGDQFVGAEELDGPVEVWGLGDSEELGEPDGVGVGTGVAVWRKLKLKSCPRSHFCRNWMAVIATWPSPFVVYVSGRAGGKTLSMRSVTFSV